MPGPQDGPAIAQCKAGEEEGFRRLFDTYRGYVYSLCLSIVCDRDEALDACQEVFLAAFRGIRRLRDGAPFKPWLRKVAVNVCLNYKASARSGARALPSAIGEVGDGEDPVRAAEAGESKRAIGEALRSLQPDQRLAVVLFHQEGLTYEEIADVSGWPVGTVKTNLYRGRKQLGKLLRPFHGGGV